MKQNAFVLFGRTYNYKEGPHAATGTEFFKDKEHTQLFAKDPYKALRCTQYRILNGVRYLVIMKPSDLNMPVTYWRNPTSAEIKFGHGATHFRDFELADVLNEKGQIKRWTVAPDDGLRYYR